MPLRGPQWLRLTRSAHSLRSYGTFAEIGRTIIRTAFSQLRHSLLWLLAAVLAMVVTYLLPPALLLTGAREAMILGAVAWMLMTLSYLPMVRFYGLRPWWALLLPLAALFYVGATVVSAVEYWAGHGGYWKGRVQDPVRSTRTESVRVRE